MKSLLVIKMMIVWKVHSLFMKVICLIDVRRRLCSYQFVCTYVCTYICVYIHVSKYILVYNNACKFVHTPITTGALSATDNDDDYRVIYTVTIVDVRSCARPPRSPDQPPASTCMHICTYTFICT